MCSSFDGLCERGYPFRRTVKRNCQLQNHVRGLVVNENGRGDGSEPAQTYGPPSRFPGRTGSGCLSQAGCWQVFGLASTSAFAAFLLSTASQLQRASACRGFVPAYRCGAVPELHRVPSDSLRILREPAWAAVYCDIRYLSTAMVWVTARSGPISTMSHAEERKSSHIVAWSHSLAQANT